MKNLNWEDWTAAAFFITLTVLFLSGAVALFYQLVLCGCKA